MRQPRTHTQVKPEDLLYCYLNGCVKPAREFVQRGPNRAEPNRAPSYRAYCKDCHRSRSGATHATLRGVKNPVRRTVLRRDPEVEAALGVLRDARGSAKGNQGYVYLITDGDLYKVGYSTNPPARVGELQTGNGRPLRLLFYFPGSEADEKALHAKYLNQNTILEWFRPTPELRSEFADHKEVITP